MIRERNKRPTFPFLTEAARSAPLSTGANRNAEDRTEAIAEVTDEATHEGDYRWIEVIPAVGSDGIGPTRRRRRESTEP